MVARKKPEPLELKFTRTDVVKSRKKLVYATATVDDIEVEHVLEFLTADERIGFVNELHRVLKPGGKARIVTPYWASNIAYSDLAFQWPPIAEGWYFHLNADWRKVNNPLEKRYRCNFSCTWGYSLHQLIASRNMEYQQHAVSFWKEAAQVLAATLVKE